MINMIVFLGIWLIAVLCVLSCCYLLFKYMPDEEKLDWHNYDGICTGLQRWCPKCLNGLEYGKLYAVCHKGHKYLIIRDEKKLKEIRKKIWGRGQ